jgi:hypothetical protein
MLESFPIHRAPSASPTPAGGLVKIRLPIVAPRGFGRSLTFSSSSFATAWEEAGGPTLPLKAAAIPPGGRARKGLAAEAVETVTAVGVHYARAPSGLESQGRPSLVEVVQPHPPPLRPRRRRLPREDPPSDRGSPGVREVPDLFLQLSSHLEGGGDPLLAVEPGEGLAAEALEQWP